jgi:hypothetical protein
MNRLYFILIILSLVACNDDFMDRFPKTEITKENFFNTATDLDTYINGLYGNISASYDDIGSDNIAQREAQDATWDLIHGAVSPDNIGGWSWSDLRAINFFLVNYQKANATAKEKEHYAGIARFFRAQFYITKVKQFSDVPWYSKPLETTDTDLLYKKQDSRGLIVDSIVADLQYAANSIYKNDDKSRITKYAALSSLARFALYEGTFRKYGMKNSSEAAYLTKQGADEYMGLLKIARDASQVIISEGGFTLSSDYAGLFNSLDLVSNSEAILVEDYELDERMHGSYTRLDWQYCLSQNLVDEYLKLDGTAYTRNELDTLQFRHSFEGRDSRLKATVSYPGWTRPGSSQPHVAKVLFGGIGQIKFTPLQPDGWSWGMSYNDLPIYRYGEILLINAEAHSELGSITDEILNNTVNLLRTRAGITGGMVTITSSVDPILDTRYPNIDATHKGAALEIRRERRIEMACEGLRYDDLMRWHLGDEILTVNGKPENLQRGIYVPQMTVTEGAKYTLLEVTGDADPDIIFAETAADLVKAEAYYASLGGKQDSIFKEMNKVSLEETIALKNGDEGHIIWNREINNPGQFIEPKYYYRPVPKSQILLNENLQQHEFWK